MHTFSCSITMMIMVMMMMMMRASGQQGTSTAGQGAAAACTGSLISSFTPCFNFLTGSTNGGGSPTADCCGALASLIGSGTECACLVLTGSVPFSIPFLGSLAISLPRACGSTSMPLRCKGTAAPLPGPGDVTYAPGLPPLASTGPSASNAVLPPLLPSPAIIADSPRSQSQRPVVVRNSAVKLSHIYSPHTIAILALGTMLLNLVFSFPFKRVD